MIWHIFKKDLRIIWPFALLVAAVHWIVPLLATIDGFAPSNVKALNVLRVLVLAGPLASGFLITAAVHLDAIPGFRQDWLVRPIRRRDLMMAKVLFAALVVQLPIAVANLTALLINHVPLSLAAASAVEHSIMQMLVIDIPFVALASMTRNFLELLGGGVALGVIVLVADALSSNTRTLEPIFRSGPGWILYLSAAVVLAAGALLVLLLQYFSRRTVAACIVTGGVTVAFLLTSYLPWSFVFLIQRSLSNNPASSQAIALTFAPDAGRLQRPVGGLTPEDALTVLRRGQGTVPVYLPVRVTGLPPDSAIQMDHAEVRVIENGRVHRLEQEPWNTRHEGSGNESNMVYPTIALPEALYDRIKDQGTRVEFDYWLTLAQVSSSQALPAIGGDDEIPGAGRCRTRVNEQQTAVGIRCTSYGPPVVCFDSFLEDNTGKRNPDRFGCGPYVSLAGFERNPVIPAHLLPDGVVLPFRDPAGLGHFPVDGSKLREARAVLQLYRAQDHFTRTLVIPEVRLGDWEAAASNLQSSSKAGAFMLRRKA
jgi:hypothetical protein